MDIFKWVKDLEDIYENLLEETKRGSLEEIREFRVIQEKNMEDLLSRKQDIVNLATKSLSVDVNEEIEDFEKRLNNSIKEIEVNFNKNKNSIKKSILKTLGLDF